MPTIRLAYAESKVDQNVPEELRPYIAQFELETGLKFKSTISFQTDSSLFKPTEAAFALVRPSQPHSGAIMIRRSAWLKYTEEQRTLLVWHELAHSVIGLSHIDGKFVNGCASSLLNPIIPEPICAELELPRYKAELKELAKLRFTPKSFYFNSK